LAVERPFAEVHLSNPEEREAFRHISLLEDVAAVAVRGMLATGYERAVALIAELRAEATK
jgi:3-dehydroquinate dehydratase-2